MKRKLTAKHFEHPDDTKPKVFISELRVNELSETAQTIIKSQIKCLNQPDADNFLYSGKHWDVSKAEYDTLLNDQNTLRGWPRGDSAQTTLP